jgi:hypothetical protein
MGYIFKMFRNNPINFFGGVLSFYYGMNVGASSPKAAWPHKISHYYVKLRY